MKRKANLIGGARSHAISDAQWQRKPFNNTEIHTNRYPEFAIPRPWL
jgi:hypothetical protein